MDRSGIVALPTAYLQLLRSRATWIHIALLMYPFAVTYAFAYLSEYADGFWKELAKATVFNAVLSCAIVSILVFALGRRSGYRVLKAIYMVQFLFLFVSVYHFAVYKEILSLASVHAVINTSLDEASEFATAYFRGGTLLAALAVSMPMCYAALKTPELFSHRYRWKWYSGTLPVMAFAALMGLSNWKEWITEYNPLVNISKSIWTVYADQYRIEHWYARMPAVPQIAALQDDSEVVHVLVISESINRSHMSLYGYGRDTNPRLNEMGNELYIARDACSSRNTTIDAVKELMTFASRENPALLFSAPNLMHIMRAAGFRTYWISNQQEIGTYNSFISVFSKSADYRQYVNRRGLYGSFSFDERLFAPLGKVLEEKAAKKFIVVHLLGAHALYNLRYPPQYDVFKELPDVNPLLRKNLSNASLAKTYNYYDNALLYNDYVVHELIRMQDRGARVTLTYISDHGESVADLPDFAGHGDKVPLRTINEIPLFFWFTEAERSALGGKLTNLKRNLAAPFQSDQTIHTLLDLYGIEYPLLNRQNSLFSADFKGKNRYCDTLARIPPPISGKAEVTAGRGHQGKSP